MFLIRPCEAILGGVIFDPVVGYQIVYYIVLRASSASAEFLNDSQYIASYAHIT